MAESLGMGRTPPLVSVAGQVRVTMPRDHFTVDSRPALLAAGRGTQCEAAEVIHRTDLPPRPRPENGVTLRIQ